MSDRLERALAELAAAIRAEVQPAPDAPDRLYSIGETGAMLGLGRSKLYALIGQGDLAVIKVGRRTLVSAGAVRDFIAVGQADR